MRSCSGASYEGLYYSSDSGATWSLATITDGAERTCRGRAMPLRLPDGNAATSVVWNPVRQLFVAAVRYHGYYQSADGITWTRMAAQPGTGLTSAAYCPTNSGGTGSIDLPDLSRNAGGESADRRHLCLDGGRRQPGPGNVAGPVRGERGRLRQPERSHLRQQWNTAALETDTSHGPATIENGDYNLALAAVPSRAGHAAAGWGQRPVADAALAQGCVWRNTTNATTCMSAQVGEYQHALAWNPANPLEIFVGNDSGLWRSMDAIGESRAPSLRRARDATHFQNLNGSLGSLAEVVSMSAGGRDALHDDGRPGRERNGGREERHRADGGLAGDSGRRGRAGGHRSRATARTGT